ncbi:hypothetical protein ACFRCI_27915 [Streptomyces sp. NPDC056638]|uniref:hypothetical protein n=1 Tax=Streptomyces sp. NPDC056638 TaxID=3345887 RepID=UPI003697AAD2
MAQEPTTTAQLSNLPGARSRLRSVAADLAAGLNCLWLLPDRLVDNGEAEELYQGALLGVPNRIDVPRPELTGFAEGDQSVSRAGDEWQDEADSTWEDWPGAADQLPFLDSYDDGFDLGWGNERWSAPIPPARRKTSRMTWEEQDLSARIAKELSVAPGEVISRLTAPEDGVGRIVVGVRAWAEPETGSARGTGVERLYRSLTTAVRAVGLPPEERPRLLVAARLSDLPAGLPDELQLDLAVTAVHWWWGALGRLDTATAIAPHLDHSDGAPGYDRDPLRERILRELRAETVIEICGPDIELAQRLAAEWDGAQRSLDTTLAECLIGGAAPTPLNRLSLPAQIGARNRPGPGIREAWANGAVVSWEGRLRLHPRVWFPSDATSASSLDTRARISSLLSQAQQRVLLPWIEEARRQLAVRALDHLNRPVTSIVATYQKRRIGYLGGRSEHAFLELQVGELLGAHIEGAITLPEGDTRLLRLLVRSRNRLSHRAILYDSALAELCTELSGADVRTA